MAGRMRIAWRESEEELRDLWEREGDHRRRRRLHVFWLLRRGYTGRAVCDIYSMDYKTVMQWRRWYNEGGLDLLLERTPGHAIGGADSWMTPQQIEQLRHKAAQGDFATASDARDWILKTFDIDYVVGSLYTIFRNHGISLKVPRPCHEKQQEGAIGAFQKGGSPTA